MNNRYKVVITRITNFEKYNNFISVKGEFPYRKCVVDLEREIAVDIELGVYYTYIKTINNNYFLGNSAKKITFDGRRYAIFERPFSYSINDKQINDIINKLESGYNFIEGNSLYDNNQYLEIIKKTEKPDKVKVKAFRRKK